MPYITQEKRDRLAQGASPQDPGELNYALTKILLEYLQSKGTSYGTVNEIMGVLNCATHEFYRRWAAPYEDKKIKDNGDLEITSSKDA